MVNSLITTATGQVKKPHFQLMANGATVGLSLGKDIKSITFDDEAGTHSDKITITVINENYRKPKKGDELILYFGYDGVPFFPCGTFKVDGSKRINNKVLVIRATGADFSSKLKEKKSATFKDTSIKDIISLKAKAHSLKFKCDFDVKIKHLTQTNQSDLDFLKKLSDEYNGLFSIKNQTLIFIKKNKKGETNKDLPVFSFDATTLSSLTIDETSKKEFKSCECKYHDHKTNKEIKVSVGEGKPILNFTGSFKDKLEAKIKAEARLDKENQGIIKGSFSAEGVTIYAGANLLLYNTIHAEDDGHYSIKTVKHKMTSSGWVIDVEFER